MLQAAVRFSAALLLWSGATVAMAQSQATSGALRDPGRPYTINAGDELEIYVWGEERLQRTIRVLPDGTFSFPLVGRVVALGQLPAQIETAITNGLSNQYRGQVPQVTVSVTAPAGLVFSVIGRVKSPNTFTPGRYVNVVEAIAMAGGGDEFANLDNVVILRKGEKGLSPMRVRLGGVMKGNVSSSSAEIPQIESGDTVIVP